MSLSIYEASVPAIIQILNAVSTVLDKAVAHCEERKIDPAVLVNYRLAPDMFALPRQVQIMTDQAKGIAARLAGVEVPSYADSEASFEDLKARIAKTVDFIKSLPAAQFEGAETRDITIKGGNGERHFKGAPYVFGFGLPNFYFHATTTYDILRHAGVPVGKLDFLGAIPTR